MSKYLGGCGWVKNGTFCDSGSLCDHCRDKHNLTKERDRYKKALEEIASHQPPKEKRLWVVNYTEVRSIAKEAINEAK